MTWRASVAITLLVVSCAGPPSPQAYGDAVQELGRDYEEETTALQRDLEAELQREVDLMRRRVDQTDSDAVARFAAQAVAVTALRTRSFFAAVGDALHRYRMALARLRPPAAVAPQHDELLAAMDSVLSGLPELLTGLDAADDFDAIDLAVHGSVFADAGPRLSAACRSLQDELGEAGVSADLRCPA